MPQPRAGNKRVAILLGVIGLALVVVLATWVWVHRADLGREPQAATTVPTSPLSTATPAALLWERLEQATLPPRDDQALVSGLGQISASDLEAATPTPATTQVGDMQRFWLGNADTAETWQITATLRVQLEHVEMWVEAGAEVDQKELERSAEVFEKRLYPLVHRVFGSEWTPGIDDDPHLVVLNASFDGAAGYFSAAQELPRSVYRYSNEHEMFFMNLYELQPGTETYNSVLVHEFQHMVHWYLDANEEGWLQEGASVLAEDLAGDEWPAQVASIYVQQPDLQLNTWTDQNDDVYAHYGAAFLFMRYFLDRFGEDAVFALVHDTRNGLDSIEAALQANADAAYSSAEYTRTDLFFADWLVANALDDTHLGDGRYGYEQMDLTVMPQALVQSLPFEKETDVQQYGADYYSVDTTALAGDALAVTFEGQSQASLVPTTPTSGNYLWWSNWGDSSDASLERTLDLSGVTTATLSFNLWYDIEYGWDYAYVRASTDGGTTWQLLRGPHMSDYNPTGGALGPGYTGLSGTTDASGEATWVREDLNLSAFCGSQVIVRFDYLTDDAFTRSGLCLDDLQVTAIGWNDDVEAGQAGWIAQGFVRVNDTLPQHYLVQWVTTREGSREVNVQRLEVDEATGRGTWLLKDLGSDTTEAWLIVSAITPWSREPASYSLTMTLP